MTETTTRAAAPETVTAARAQNKVLRKAFRDIEELVTVGTKYGPVTTDRYVMWVHEQAPAWLRPALDSLPCDGIWYDYQHAAKSVSSGNPRHLGMSKVQAEPVEVVIDWMCDHRIEDALTPGGTTEIRGTTARVYRSGHRGALVDAVLDLTGLVIADSGQHTYDKHAAKVAEIDANPPEPLSAAAMARLSFQEQREATKIHASAKVARDVARRALGSPHNAPLAIFTPDGALAGVVCPLRVTDETFVEITEEPGDG